MSETKVRKPSGWKVNAGSRYYTKDSKYGVRYLCKTCGKEALGLADRRHNHKAECPHAADHSPPLPREAPAAPRTFESSLGMEEALDAAGRTKRSGALERGRYDVVGGRAFVSPLPLVRDALEALRSLRLGRGEPTDKADTALAAFRTLERGVPLLLAAYHWSERAPIKPTLHAPTDWRKCPDCHAMLEPK